MLNALATGNHRSRAADSSCGVARTRDALIDELKALLYGPEDVRFDTGCSSDGDFIRVIHLPTGIERVAMRRDNTHLVLLNEVLEEVFSQQLGIGHTS